METFEKKDLTSSTSLEDLLAGPEKVQMNLNAEVSDEELAAIYLGNELDPELQEMVSSLDSVGHARVNKIMVPDLLNRLTAFSGVLYGFVREDSGYHAILGWEGAEPAPELEAVIIGTVGGADPGPGRISGRWEDGELHFRWNRSGILTELKKEIYTLKQDIFSRNSGLMESDWMDKKCVVISGCGSVGSCMALQLARSGVGHFVLIDSECMEIHNVCRHQCSLKDIGRYKVDAVAERIRQINPQAQVRKFYQRIQEVPLKNYKDWMSAERALFIGACDNRVGNAYACDAAYSIGAPFLALGFMPRAWGGEIFYGLPERHDICYRCAFRNQINSAIAEERHSHTYMDEEDAGIVHFEPGLDVDLEYGVSLTDKVALDLLNRHNPDYHFRLLDKLTQFTVFSGTGDRTGVDQFWNRAFKKPVDYCMIALSDKVRRKDCAYCCI